MYKKKIAIIGGGFYGCTAALILSKKYDVEIFEKENDILNGASKVNQFRFHRGYHYPRSQITIDQIKNSYKKFIKFFGNDVLKQTKNYYAIPKYKSMTSYYKFIQVLLKNKLFYKEVKNKKLFSNRIEGAIISNEKTLNYFKIKKKIKKLIIKKKIKINYSTLITKNILSKFSKIIICCYANNNSILKKLGVKKINKLKYELVEKILIKLPNKYKNLSFVVIDGKFVCLDPYLGTNFHLLSDVKYSKIEIKENKYPNFKNSKHELINNKVNYNLKKSNYKKFILNGSKYLPFLNYSKYIGSFYVVRAIKRNVENTDERLSEITKINSKIYTIFSSKWNGCVDIAEKLLKRIQ